MNPLKELLKIFDIDIDDIKEELMTIQLKKKVRLDKFPDLKKIRDIISFFPYRDDLTINMLDGSEAIQVVNKELVITEDDYNKFINENRELENEIVLSIDITKSCEEEKISIYSLKSFINLFDNKRIIDLMKIFSNRLSKFGKIIFVNYNDLSNFYTKTISMINEEQCFENKVYNRNENLDKMRNNCNFINEIEYKLLPEDFDIEYSSISEEVKEKFCKIKMILSLIFLSNISKIEDNKLDVHISGYQNRNFNIELESIENSENSEYIYEIYKWTYKDGNISDKINLVRNVISLHCKYLGILDIDSKVLASIKSNYEIYLKKNLDKYIELKNKVTEFTMQMYNQINDILLEFVNSLKNNIIAFITFILGTILTNIVSENKLNNILTDDIVAICYWLLVGSVFYLVISLFEFQFKFDRYANSYQRLKKSYKDILDEEDIEEIFNNDRDYIENMKLVIDIKKKYTLLWIMLIIVTGMAIAIFKNIDVIGKIQAVVKIMDIILKIFIL